MSRDTIFALTYQRHEPLGLTESRNQHEASNELRRVMSQKRASNATYTDCSITVFLTDL
jgi:hypothetical protein